ncbi:MAG: UvrD-helicase domain-containing protein, partial [Maritimibacter sp.]|nr:UvrD-helicase domain-containing protein [Maritimibacter sp.]
MHDDATLRQIEAADPTANTWLSANAGSGKTRVLTNRVARLLLTGVSPQNILCLTYTKAAASEMQNRLFGTLGDWAMKPEGALRKELEKLGETDTGDLSRARRLFAAAIETPGGLKIQTIHSFCAAILRRFPLEAGVSPQFQEIDERSAKLLQADVLDAMALGPERAALEGLARFYTEADFTALTAEIVRRRGGFAGAVAEAEIWGWFDLAPGFGEAEVPEIAFEGSERALIQRAGPILAGQSPTMQTLAATLANLNFDAPGRADLDALFEAFLYKGTAGAMAAAKTKSVPTKKAAEALGATLGPFHDFMERVARAREAELALDAARKTLALHRFARPFVAEYETRKQ